MSIILITDAKYSGYVGVADEALRAPISSTLVFDSYSCSTVLVSVLLDAMSAHLGPEIQKRLEAVDKSTKSRKVFVS